VRRSRSPAAAPSRSPGSSSTPTAARSVPPTGSPTCAAGSRSAGRWAGSAPVSTMPPRRRSPPAGSGRCCPGHEFDNTPKARTVVIDRCYGFYHHQRRHQRRRRPVTDRLRDRRPHPRRGTGNPPRFRGTTPTPPEPL